MHIIWSPNESNTNLIISKYVYMRELRQVDYMGHNIYAVLARSENFDSEPERSGVIRVDDYTQSAALTSDGKGGT